MLGGAAALFQLRLLEAYLALPDPDVFSNEHQGLSKLCTRAFRGSTAPTTAAPGIACAWKQKVQGGQQSENACAVLQS